MASPAACVLLALTNADNVKALATVCRVFDRKAHAARDCVGVYNWWLSANHLCPKYFLTDMQNGVDLISYSPLSVLAFAHCTSDVCWEQENGSLKLINTFTMIKAISRFNYSHHAMPSAQIQWQSSSQAVTSPVSLPMFKVCGVDGFVQNWRAFQGTVETLYSTIYYSKYFIELNIDKSTQYVALWTHKRHPIPRPFGRAMECLLWVFQQKLIVL